LHATGARPRRSARTGIQALTSAERRVVELASDGLTNRQIADRLVLAPKTVEWHLSHAFAKLGIRSRRELDAVRAQT
jgi:DNA-binding CsgD family transcriptional regulator